MVSNIPSGQRFSATLDAWIGNLANTGRGKKQVVGIAVDSVLVVCALWLAYSLRHGEAFSDFKATWHLFLLMPVLTVLIFTSLGIYRWVVRSTSRRLFRQLIKGCIVSSLAVIFLSTIIPPDRVTPRSLFAIYGMLLVIGTCGLRFIWQELFDAGKKGEPVAVYGAGVAGRQLVNLLTLGSEFQPVVFLDDDPLLTHTMIAELPVWLGDASDLEARMKRLDINRVVLAIPTLGPAEYQQKLAFFENIDIPVLTMPTIAELMSGAASPDQIRDVSIQDILGRSEVPPNQQLMGQCVTGKSVMVTGGGGSIGSELCRQIAALSPAALVIVDNCEANLYHITEELESWLKSDGHNAFIFKPTLCSVTDKARIAALIQEHSITTVYHAAAYKHVPIIEMQPEQGVEVNVFGTLNVLDAAIANDVEHFVLISTDKAVRPTNAMGATKRTAELILQAKARDKHSTCISMVRFGNVLGSSGSVVPKFKRQILEGGPVTLTDPNITRYFMTIPEAAQLVLQASAISTGGDVFVLDMGEPVRIEDLAVSMVRLYGKRLSRDTGNSEDIEIVVQGLRPGEKMYEEMFINGSNRRTQVAKVFTADESWLEWGVLEKNLNELRLLSKEIDRNEIKIILFELAFSDCDCTQISEKQVKLKKLQPITQAMKSASQLRDEFCDMPISS